MKPHKFSDINSSYRQHISQRLTNSSERIAGMWLEQLNEILDENMRDIFPTELMLDHIPSMIEEVAKIIAQPENDLAVSSSLITKKAMSLGELRYEQNATVNQLLREYDVLAGIFEEFITKESNNYEGDIGYKDCIQLMAGVAHVVRMILQGTVDTFIEKYMSTISKQTKRISSFNKFVSHEIKTPLQAAMLNTELMLEDKSLNDDNIKELLIIKSSIQQVSLILKNIEELVDLEVDETKSPIMQELKINTLVKDIQIQLADMLEQNNVRMEIGEDLGKTTLETAKLKLILTNIITNAIKYCDPHKKNKFVKIDKINSQNKDKIILEVADNGLGIPKTMHEDIFNLRVRAHTHLDESSEIDGHGLGLFLAREAAESIGGKIELESEEKKGSTFFITIPV